MRDAIRKGRHAFFAGLFADVYQVVSSLLWRLLGLPILKIHVPAPLIHIVDDHPRHGREAAIPGPHRLVGMAIATGTHKGGLNVIGNRDMSGKRSGRNDRRVRPLRLHKLYGDQKYSQGEDDFFHPGFVHFKISICGAFAMPSPSDLRFVVKRIDGCRVRLSLTCFLVISESRRQNWWGDGTNSGNHNRKKTKDPRLKP